MDKTAILYEEHPELDGLCLVPMKMIIRFGRGDIRWDEPSVYFPINAPFEQLRLEDFNDDTMSLSIIQADLIRNFEKPDQFGVYLPFVIERMESSKNSYGYDFDYYEIEQFIIQMDDLEEVLQMNIRRFYDWR